MGNLAFGSVDALVLGDLFKIFNRLVHKVADVVDFSQDLRVCVPLDKLLQLAVDHADAFDVS